MFFISRKFTIFALHFSLIHFPEIPHARPLFFT
jgi:hypothetical protein